MKILVIGSGGREHALARKLSAEGTVREVISAPGNPGMATVGRTINIDVTATQMEWGAFVADNKKSNDSCGKEGTDIYSSANTFRPDPDGYLYPYFHSKGEINKGGCDTPDAKLDALLVEARQSSNHAERKRLYEEIQRHAMRESLDWWWYAKYNIEATSNKLQGYSQSFTGRRLFLKKAWLA